MTPTSALITTAALECHHLSKSFGAVQAVRDVSLTVNDGEFITLLGPSGCGKTTTLRLIAGFELPERGKIALHGRVVTENGSGLPPEKRQIGMVFQDYALFPHLNVGDNVAFGLRSNRQEKAARVDEMLALVGLEGLAARMPHELSGGQQQRVALARALAPQPDLVLLDEPFSNLDAALRVRVRTEVRAILKTAGVTVVFVTHDQEEALSLSDRVAVMFEGKIAQFDASQTVYHRPADREVAAFVGESNFIPAQADGTTAHSALGKITLDAPSHGNVEVLIRPEMIALSADGESGVLAEVGWVEFYGPAQRVELKLISDDGTRHSASLLARFDTTEIIRPGDIVRVGVRGSAVAF